MDWIFDNPLGSLPGPAFLGYYAALIAVTLGWCWARVRRTMAAELPGQNKP